MVWRRNAFDVQLLKHRDTHPRQGSFSGPGGMTDRVMLTLKFLKTCPTDVDYTLQGRMSGLWNQTTTVSLIEALATRTVWQSSDSGGMQEDIKEMIALCGKLSASDILEGCNSASFGYLAHVAEAITHFLDQCNSASNLFWRLIYGQPNPRMLFPSDLLSHARLR